MLTLEIREDIPLLQKGMLHSIILIMLIMEKQEQEERKHIEALDRKIERLQEKVIKKHKEYSVLAEELSTLLDERHPERKIERVKQMLYDAFEGLKGEKTKGLKAALKFAKEHDMCMTEAQIQDANNM